MNSAITTEVSKGQLFKEKHGISKTQYRVLRKRELLKTSNPTAKEVEEAKVKNREFRKKRLKDMKTLRKAKADKAKAGQKTKSNLTTKPKI